MTPGALRDVRLLQLFDELSDVSAEEQLRRIAALAPQDRDLADALRGMLGADADAGGPLESGVDSLVEALVSDESRPLLAGQRIGAFVLERPLGRGGMGEVWLASREEAGFRQTVALKRLKRGMDSDEILRRFVQERRILADLSHPHIARFIDGGVGTDGVPWYAMEYVDGATITAHADARALDVRARVALLVEVAEAVAYAQNRLVVHRDLKPSNILVDEAGVPHLLDFGIAKLLQGSDEPQATATGVRALSPAYAAPEQILDQSISAATDVYALGVVLYELLTGELPHVRSGLSLEALVDSVRDETIERPSARLRASTTLAGESARTQQTVRVVSGELDAIVLTALRREPERRYANAAALADDLRRWLDGRPVRAQPDTATYRMRKFVVRNRLAVGSASAVLLALIAGFGTALWQASVARGQAGRAQQQSEVASAVTAFLTQDVIQAANPFRNPLQLSVSEALRRAAPAIDARFADQPRVAGVVRNQLSESLYLAGDSATAETVSAAAQRGLEQAYGDLDPDALAARLQRARLLIIADRWDEAQALYDAVRPRLVGASLDSFRLQADIGLAGLMIERRQETQGLALLDQLAPELEAAFDPLDQVFTDAVAYRLSAYTQTERWAEALAICQRYDGIAAERFGEQSSRRLEWMRRQAQLLRLFKRFDEAQQLGEAALSLAALSVGDDHFATDEIRQVLVPVYFEKRDFARAAEIAERVVAFREQQFGARSEKTWFAWVWQARSYQFLGRTAEARALFEKAASAARETHGPLDPNVLGYQQTLGMFLQQTGQLADAEALRRQILARAQELLPDGHINIAKYAWDLGETLASAGRHAEVRTLLALWLPRWEQLFGSDNSRVDSAKQWLAKAQAP